MINILWSILNVALLLSMLYIFFRAAQLVKQYVGSGAALFFVFSLLLIGCAKSNKQSSSTTENMLFGIAKDAPLGNGSTIERIPLGGYNKLILLAEYHQNNGVVKPRGLYATVSGFLLGHTWRPIGGSLRQRNQQLHYTAVMHHAWGLLGMQVYSNMEQFTGEMLVSKAQR